MTDRNAERFPADWFKRMEESPDEEFYKLPRKEVLLGDDGIAALRDFYDAHLEGGWQVLDLMSGWRSHLPKMKDLTVAGLGMNAEEMYENPRLDESVVQNLNTDAGLPFEDDRFDAALCALSIQYLIRPIEVCREVARVLKPGAPFFISISNQSYQTKTVAIWNNSNDQQHIQLVAGYLQASERFQDIQAEDHSPDPYVSDPLFLIWGFALE